MDRNTAFGLGLIAVILLVYFYWFAPKPKPEQTPSLNPVAAVDTLRSSAPDTTHLAQSSGDTLYYNKQGEEKLTTVENEELKIIFSSHGGRIVDLVLKNSVTYYGKPIRLVGPEFFSQHLTGQTQNGKVDLYDLYYDLDTKETDSSTVITYSSPLAGNTVVKQTYTIPQKGYQIPYQLNVPNAESVFTESILSLTWESDLPLLEKDLHDSRSYSTVTYYSESSGFDELSQRSTSDENEVFANPLKWVVFKDKFFLTGIIAHSSFSGGEVMSRVNQADTSVVKHATARLFIPVKDLSQSPAYSLFFGPNDYTKLGEVAPEFRENVYLGWPPVKWVNKYLVVPLFYFLTDFIGNFGIVIIILVIIIRALLLPLSYRSYKSMAKMRLLKPELDELKARVGDDAKKVQQEQLKLYQQVGVNPISGCVPLLLQMPILFAMFYLFPNNIDLRQQSFLWAEDLSTYDSILKLPFNIPFYGDHVSLFCLLMTVSTLIYTWQNNQITSVQGPMKSMSYIMPLVFLFILNSFPAGLSFYYFVTNLVTFGQQAVIKRFVDEDKIREVMAENKRRYASGGKKSKFMAKLEEAMKAGDQARKKSKR